VEYGLSSWAACEVGAGVAVGVVWVWALGDVLPGRFTSEVCAEFGDAGDGVVEVVEVSVAFLK
jgi:hypothetical protein